MIYMDQSFSIPPDFQIKPMPKSMDTGSLLEPFYDWWADHVGIINSHTLGLTGKGAIIGIVDTGAYLGHPDLSDQNIIATGFSVGISSLDGHGHATWIRGIIGALHDDGPTLKGIAPDARFILHKGLGDGAVGGDSSISKGINFCLDHGATIINLSLGSPKNMPKVKKAIERAEKMGVPVVCASGNSGNKPVMYPAKLPSTIATSAVDRGLMRAWFSNTGDELDIAAPGVEIMGTWINGGYEIADGTSGAAPIVTGVIALLQQYYYEKHSSLPTTDEIRGILIGNAKDIEPVGDDPLTGAGLVTTTFNPYMPLPLPPKKTKSMPWQYIIYLALMALGYLIRYITGGN